MHPDLPAEIILHGTAGPLTVRFAVPKSLSVRYDVTYHAAHDRPTAYAAALGVMSPQIRHNVPYRFQGVAEYGHAVADWLLAAGVKYPEVQEAGQTAWVHCSYGLLDMAEVQAARDFSGPTSEPSTS